MGTGRLGGFPYESELGPSMAGDPTSKESSGGPESQRPYGPMCWFAARILRFVQIQQVDGADEKPVQEETYVDKYGNSCEKNSF